jgi:hypothetical protein
VVIDSDVTATHLEVEEGIHQGVVAAAQPARRVLSATHRGDPGVAPGVAPEVALEVCAVTKAGPEASLHRALVVPVEGSIVARHTDTEAGVDHQVLAAGTSDTVTGTLSVDPEDRPNHLDSLVICKRMTTKVTLKKNEFLGSRWISIARCVKYQPLVSMPSKSILPAQSITRT